MQESLLCCNFYIFVVISVIKKKRANLGYKHRVESKAKLSCLGQVLHFQAIGKLKHGLEIHFLKQTVVEANQSRTLKNTHLLAEQALRRERSLIKDDLEHSSTCIVTVLAHFLLDLLTIKSEIKNKAENGFLKAIHFEDLRSICILLENPTNSCCHFLLWVELLASNLFLTHLSIRLSCFNDDETGFFFLTKHKIIFFFERMKMPWYFEK